MSEVNLGGGRLVVEGRCLSDGVSKSKVSQVKKAGV